MKNVALALLASVLTTSTAWAQPIVTPAPSAPPAHARRSEPLAPGPLEIALQVTGNVTWTETTTQSGEKLSIYVPNVEAGGWIGTGLGRDSTFGYALGYHGRISRAPAETAQRHGLSLGLVKTDGAGFLDVGVGRFDSDTVVATSIFFGMTVQAKLGTTGFSLVLPIYCDVLVDPSVSAWVTMGFGIGYTSL